MQAGQRHVLTFDKRPIVKKVLGEISEGVQSDGNVRREIRRGLEEFAKHGGVRLILDLQVTGPATERPPATIRNLTAFVAGEVLIVTGQVTPHLMLRMLQIKAQSRWHFFQVRLISRMGALILDACVDVGIAAQRVARPIKRAWGIVARVPAR